MSAFFDFVLCFLYDPSTTGIYPSRHPLSLHDARPVLSLIRHPAGEVTVAGGRLRNLDRDMLSGEAHGFFGRFAVDIGIYGVGGVAEDGTLLDFSLDEVHMRESLAQQDRKRVV